MVIITGDLIDFYEAETANDIMLATQIEQFVPLFFECPVPLFMILGNHDIASYWVDEQKEKRNFQKHVHLARAAWIKNVPCFQQGVYYGRSFQVGQTNYRLIFLDNAYSMGNGSYIGKEQLDWLSYQLKKYNQSEVILFMHKYFPLPDENGDGMVFTEKTTLLIDKESCSTGLLKILNENPNIKLLVTGHGHKNVQEVMVLPSGHRILQVETGGFGPDSNNWRLIQLTETSIIIMPCGKDMRKSVLTID
jgi:3',5'-cyclic AMP phosphodiesterase CpdA